MRFLPNNTPSIDPEKKFTVELTLVELAAIGALTGHSNNHKTGMKVATDFGEEIAPYIEEFDVNGKLFREISTKLRGELR